MNEIKVVLRSGPLVITRLPGAVPVPVTLLPIGVPGPEGPGHEGFGWVDYSDTTAGVETAMLAGVRTQVSRELTASLANNKLAGPWLGHNFWGGVSGNRKLVTRALNDVIAFSFALRVRPALVSGILTCEIDVGGSIGTVFEKAQPLTSDAGAIQVLRFDGVLATRSTFLANGGRVYLTSSVPAALVEFSPEIYPLSFTP